MADGPNDLAISEPKLGDLMPRGPVELPDSNMGSVASDIPCYEVDSRAAVEAELNAAKRSIG
jgi:hypothetical protein